MIRDIFENVLLKERVGEIEKDRERERETERERERVSLPPGHLVFHDFVKFCKFQPTPYYNMESATKDQPTTTPPYILQSDKTVHFVHSLPFPLSLFLFAHCVTSQFVVMSCLLSSLSVTGCAVFVLFYAQYRLCFPPFHSCFSRSCW